MGTAALGLLAVVAIILVAQMQRQARRHRAQLTRLVRMLEQSLPPNPPLPVEMPELDEELAALIPSISQLLALRDDQNQNRYQLLKELARGLNHNMNNLLFGILGATQLIERHSDDDEIRNWAKVAHSDGQKLTDLVKQLTEAVTEHVDQTPDNLDLSSLISNLLNQQQPRWLEQAIAAGQRIDFQVELAEPCRAIRANPGGITGML
jgi:signal transduction histidine kinase